MARSGLPDRLQCVVDDVVGDFASHVLAFLAGFTEVKAHLDPGLDRRIGDRREADKRLRSTGIKGRCGGRKFHLTGIPFQPADDPKQGREKRDVSRTTEEVRQARRWPDAVLYRI